MPKLTYMPNPGDPETTIVDGVKFSAFEAVELHELKADLLTKLSNNPWFSHKEVDADRKARWDKHKNAGAEADAAAAVKAMKGPPAGDPPLNGPPGRAAPGIAP